MIARLSGRIVEKREGAVVLDISGVGFLVHVTSGFLSQPFGPNDTVTLHTYTCVRENDISLYGFTNPKEVDLFRTLLGVSGIGPRTALACLSSLSPETLQSAVSAGDARVFTRIPGVGNKTAQRMLLDLQGKIGTLGISSASMTLQGEDQEVVEALMALGYSSTEASSALRAIPKEAETIDQRILAALQSLGR